MNALLIIVSVLFFLQIFTNISLLVVMRKLIGINKQNKVNLNHIFEGIKNEHI